VSAFVVRTLRGEDDTTGFTSGSRDGAPAIDAYLREQALHEHHAQLCSVWIVLPRTAAASASSLCAYFTLSPLSIPLNEVVLTAIRLPETRYRSVGGYLLGRLGVSVAFQGRQLGDACVSLALGIAKAASEKTGGAFVAVDPKNDSLVRWYERLGFARLDPSRRRLVRRL
jgi:GNAT superfamily N-acetyltransferase